MYFRKIIYKFIGNSKPIFITHLDMQARRLIIGYIFYISISVWIVIIYGFMSLKNLWAPLIGYYILSYFIHVIWSKIRARQRIELFDFFIIFLYKSSIYLSISILCIWGFLYYQNNILPAQLPSHTLSNWKQTIVFQTMSHIWSKEFYYSVINNIQKNKLLGAVLYYEWVGPWNQKNTDNFNTALWIKLSPETYDNFSKLYGVESQDNSKFLGIVNNLDYNIDLNLDEVMNLYDKKTNSWSQKKSWILENKQVQDINEDVISKLSDLWDKELFVLRYINQWILNFMIKHEWLRNIIISKIANQDIFSVILDDRNKHLTQEILTRGDDKIIILYGLMHFEWVLELLQSQDSSWEIISTQHQQIISN